MPGAATDNVLLAVAENGIIAGPGTNFEEEEPVSFTEDIPALGAAKLEVARPGITILEGTEAEKLAAKLFATGTATVDDPIPSALMVEVALTGEVLPSREPTVKFEMPVSPIVEVLVPGTLTVEAAGIGNLRVERPPSEEATSKEGMSVIPKFEVPIRGAATNEVTSPKVPTGEVAILCKPVVELAVRGNARAEVPSSEATTVKLAMPGTTMVEIEGRVTKTGDGISPGTPTGKVGISCKPKFVLAVR
jgi:hypothetical protein